MAAETYTARLSQQVMNTLLAVSDAEYERLDAFLALLETQPHMGRSYDPDYEVTLPPVAFLYVYVPETHWFFLYQADDGARELKMMLLGDTRRDPRSQFAHVRPGDYSA